jgi:transcriptional repressor NrdR
MIIACRKRPVSVERLRTASASVERTLYQDYEDEVTTSAIGEMVMQELREIDTVAYVRFASVYREFQTVSDFRTIVESVNDLKSSV